MSAALARVARVAAAALAIVLAPLLGGGVGAQEPVPVDTTIESPSLFERLNLDKLRLVALGASVGAVKPSQTRTTQAYAVHADYGRVAERWNIVFSVTYWGSRYDDETLQRFADTLQNVIVGDTSTYEIDLGEVSISDIALGTELRWMPRRAASTVLRPYLGGGLAAHVVNAEGRAISGTFVERALDNITAGVIAVAGVDAVFLDHLSLGMQARYDLLSGSRFGALRLVGTYVFDPLPPSPTRTGDGR